MKELIFSIHLEDLNIHTDDLLVSSNETKINLKELILMAIDIYLRIPTDPNYDPTQIDGDDQFQQFLQLIEMLLTTKKGEVLGNPELGCNLEQFLWNDQISSSTIKTEIMTQILSYGSDYGNRIQYDVDVNFVTGPISDSILVDIYIEDQKVLGIAATP